MVSSVELVEQETYFEGRVRMDNHDARTSLGDSRRLLRGGDPVENLCRGRRNERLGLHH